MIDVHSYGKPEAMNANAHLQGNYLSWIAAGQVYGKPLTITEWNVEYPKIDRFTSPLYVASIASLQGWDAPMVYTYTQMPFLAPGGPEKWSTYFDPAITGIMPAAALVYRQGHVSPAKTTYCLMLDPAQLFDRDLTPDTSATIRTLTERSKLTIGMPPVKELPWLKPTKPSSEATILTDPDHDFIPEGQSFVRSDTDELTRDWELGVQTIDSPKTQAVSGWIGGKVLKTRDVTFETSTAKAVIALSSVDNRPLNTSRFIMITAVAACFPAAGIACHTCPSPFSPGSRCEPRIPVCSSALPGMARSGTFKPEAQWRRPDCGSFQGRRNSLVRPQVRRAYKLEESIHQRGGQPVGLRG